MSARGNYVSEWFGRRVYPLVDRSAEGLAGQQGELCPFLSHATKETKGCVKPAASRGICTINTPAALGMRDEWLICPYRALDQGLIDSVARRLYGVPASTPVLVVPAPMMARTEDRERLVQAIERGETAVLYLQNTLGGEISVSSTEESPEMSFDITMVQVTLDPAGAPVLGRYGILEVQTMDFHGSYRAVVKNLNDLLRMFGPAYYDHIAATPALLSQKIEGPNLANVFKRTFYQIAIKIQLAADDANCAGAVLALPTAVWDSWQRHLGRPDVIDQGDGTSAFSTMSNPAQAPGWIYIFEVDGASADSPSPIRVTKVIATDTDSLVHQAMKVAPQAMALGSGAITASIKARVGKWWPALAPLRAPRKRRIIGQKPNLGA